jgi:hypothetical protein
VRMKVRIAVVAILGVLVLIAGVLVLMRTGTRTATVEKVLDNPGSYYGHLVRVEGTVSDDMPGVPGFHVFRLDDGTGKVWVITRLSAPSSGARIEVEGHVETGAKTGIPIVGSITVGTFMLEEKRSVAKQ